MIETVGAIAAAIAAVAGLLLYLFKTRWSERARWEQELKRLETENETARKQYREAVAAGAVDHEQLRARWLVCATNVSNHRAAGQRAGFLDRAQ